MEKNKQTPMQFTIQTGSINITAYLQEDEKSADMLKRVLEMYKLVKLAEEKLQYGLLKSQYRGSEKTAFKPKWKEGDAEPKCPI